ncbi:hypothetical protein EJ05DRAFT_302521 [Pseudovirgaria hyperparasitica]|uniref:Uncharacterized protein n=1 Tax=Pseudovirgaria hyperparasitica TaxID=470096 RepID=A0A6A6WBM2_9PEZI|nr:uncharacterized protein EJ05DRAFT_302521 [Pseudovirgaria hyperparasitica]KAF2759569.1 hypothetical protein EJ05DRAFT_302521 [Pseudovirgaria hyperparasitica]
MELPHGPLSENIGLLAQFGKVLARPTTNVPQTILLEQDSRGYVRALSFRQELRTAEAFALLLSTTHDYKKVGAVCIEEDSLENRFIVRSAVNLGEQKQRKQTFDRLLQAGRKSAELGDSSGILVLDAAVETNHKRILGRLRSKHGPKSPVRSLISRLDEELKVARPLGDTTTMTKLRQSVQRLSSNFRSFEALPRVIAHGIDGRVAIRKILLIIHADFDFGAFHDLQSRHRPRHPDLEKKLRKLSQYVSTSQHIARIIRRHSNWKFAEVLNGPYANKIGGAQPEGTGLLTRSLSSKKTKEREQFEVALGTSLNKKCAAVQAIVYEGCNLECKVHAEVQIIYHYLQNPQVTVLPRVIASNKKACYLCDLFSKTHGVYYIPKTHGRLYPKWRLPETDELILTKQTKKISRGIVSNFSKAVEEVIKQKCQLRMARIPQPSESSAFRSGSNTASVISGAVAAAFPSNTSITVANLNSATKVTETVLSSRSEFDRADTVQIDTGFLQNNEPSIRDKTLPSSRASSAVPSETTPQSVTINVIKQESTGDAEGSSQYCDAQPATSLPSLHNSKYSDSLDATGHPLSPRSSCRSESPGNKLLESHTFHLAQGQAQEITIVSGQTVRVHTPKIRIEILNSSSKATGTAELEKCLNIEWLSQRQSTACPHESFRRIDVMMEGLDAGEIECDQLMQDGVILFKGTCSVMMKVI